MKIGRNSVKCAVCVALLCAGVLALVASANELTVVSLEPPVQQLASGDSFTLQVRIEDVADMLGANVAVEFDPSLVQFQNILLGDLFPAGSSSSVYSVDNENGELSYAVTLLGESTPIAGAGVLCEIQGQVLAPGDAHVTIARADLANSDIRLIPVATSDAVLRIGAGRAYLPLLAGVAAP